MIGDIKKLLEKHQSISLYDLSVRFEMEISAMEKMLEMWVRKGKITKKDYACSSSGCGGCLDCSCDASKMIMYGIS